MKYKTISKLYASGNLCTAGSSIVSGEQGYQASTVGMGISIDLHRDLPVEFSAS